MAIVYQVLKVVFILLSVALWLLYRKWAMLFTTSTVSIIKQLVLPGYIVLCGVMIGYLLFRGWSNEEHQEHTWLNTFLLWCGLGVIGALIYIFSQ